MKNKIISDFPVIDGGASSGFVPHFLFGSGPISKIRVPPSVISFWVIQVLVIGLPFNVADWIYLLFSELFIALIINVFLFPRSIVTSPNKGLPMA